MQLGCLGVYFPEPGLGLCNGQESRRVVFSGFRALGFREFGFKGLDLQYPESPIRLNKGTYLKS